MVVKMQAINRLRLGAPIQYRGGVNAKAKWTVRGAAVVKASGKYLSRLLLNEIRIFI